MSSYDGSFNKCSSLFILNLLRLPFQLFSSGKFCIRMTARLSHWTWWWRRWKHKTDCELCVSCMAGYKKIRAKDALYENRKNGWRFKTRSLVIVINWLYLLFTTSKLNHKNWEEKETRKIIFLRCTERRSHHHQLTFVFAQCRHVVWISQFYFILI